MSEPELAERWRDMCPTLRQVEFLSGWVWRGTCEAGGRRARGGSGNADGVDVSGFAL